MNLLPPTAPTLLLTLSLGSLLASPAQAQPSPAAPPAGSDGPATADPAAPSAPAEPAPTPPPPAPPAPATSAPSPPATPLVVDDAMLTQLIQNRLDAEQAKRAPVAGWDDGFYVQSPTSAFKLRIGGIIQFDGRYFLSDTDDPHTDQFAFRSIRPDLQATLYDHYDIRFLPDFAGGKLVVQEAYTDIHYGDALKFRIGKFKVPFGLERLQGEVATTFTERGLPTQVAPNRDLGIQIFGELAKGTIEYQAGVFNGVADGQSGDGDVSDDKEIAARVFLKPFLHGVPLLKGLGFGGAVTYGDKLGTVASPDVALFKNQGQNTFFTYKIGTTLVDTAIADGPHWRATAQGYYYAGPLGVLGEVVRSRQKVAIDGSHQRVTVDSWQLLAQYVLTGDNASYKGVAPKHPFDPSKHQWGAFDIAARISQLRVPGADVYPLGLADPTKSAHQAWSAGGGLDWNLNRSVRLFVDYDHVWYDRGAKLGNKPDENSIVGRFQTAF